MRNWPFASVFRIFSGSSTPLRTIIVRTPGNLFWLCSASSVEVVWSTTLSSTTRLRHAFSQRTFRRTRVDPSHRCSDPLGDHTSAFCNLRQYAKVGNVGNEYTAIKCTISAHAMYPPSTRSKPADTE